MRRIMLYLQTVSPSDGGHSRGRRREEKKMSVSREDKRKKTTRIICLVIAGVMIFSVLAAAILSQVW